MKYTIEEYQVELDISFEETDASKMTVEKILLLSSLIASALNERFYPYTILHFEPQEANIVIKFQVTLNNYIEELKLDYIISLLKTFFTEIHRYRPLSGLPSIIISQLSSQAVTINTETKPQKTKPVEVENVTEIPAVTSDELRIKLKKIDSRGFKATMNALGNANQISEDGFLNQKLVAAVISSETHKEAAIPSVGKTRFADLKTVLTEIVAEKKVQKTPREKSKIPPLVL